jgi:hypothetical protein
VQVAALVLGIAEEVRVLGRAVVEILVARRSGAVALRLPSRAVRRVGHHSIEGTSKDGQNRQAVAPVEIGAGKADVFIVKERLAGFGCHRSFPFGLTLDGARF